MGLSARRRKPEQLLLSRPGDRKVHGSDQPMGGQVGRLASHGDRFDNVRRQEGERQHAADVAIANLFERREFGDTTDLIELDSSFGCSPHLPGSHNPLILQGAIQIQCP